jgi:hypothetical protein
VCLDRLSPLREWLRRPAARARLQPVLEAMQRQFLGGEEQPAGGGDDDNLMAASFVSGFPLAKLVTFGALSEEDVAQLVAAENAEPR